MNVSLKIFPKFSFKLLFLKCYWMVAPKIQTTFFTETLMDAYGWMKKDHRGTSNYSKVILVPNNCAQELYWS